MNKDEFISIGFQKGLKVYSDKNPTKTNIVAMSKKWCWVSEKENSNCLGYGDNIENYLPICRPLSDLTKPITHKGETFVPIVELAKVKDSKFDFTETFVSESDRFYSAHNSNGNPNASSFFLDKRMSFNEFRIVQKLIEWHFDVAGLIEKGEAIDVNTLNENPYK